VKSTERSCLHDVANKGYKIESNNRFLFPEPFIDLDAMSNQWALDAADRNIISHIDRGRVTQEIQSALQQIVVRISRKEFICGLQNMIDLIPEGTEYFLLQDYDEDGSKNWISRLVWKQLKDQNKIPVSTIDFNERDQLIFKEKYLNGVDTLVVLDDGSFSGHYIATLLGFIDNFMTSTFKGNLDQFEARFKVRIHYPFISEYCYTKLLKLVSEYQNFDLILPDKAQLRVIPSWRNFLPMTLSTDAKGIIKENLSDKYNASQSFFYFAHKIPDLYSFPLSVYPWVKTPINSSLKPSGEVVRVTSYTPYKI